MFLFLSIFLFTYKKGNRFSNRILAAFFLFDFFFTFQVFLIHNGIYFSFRPLHHSVSSVFYFMGPILFFYTKSLCYKDFRFGKRTALHLLPFVFMVAATFSIHHLRMALWPSTDTSRGSLFGNYETITYFSIINGFLIFYCLLSLRTLRQYRRDLKNQFSNINKIDLSWLSLVILVYMCIWLVDLTTYILSLMPHRPLPLISALDSISGAINFAFAIFIVYRGLKQSKFFEGISGQKSWTSGLPQREIEDYREKVEAFMKEQKPFLDPDLSLNSLADELSMPARVLSQVINESFSQNFFDFISDHRIIEAKRMLSDPDQRDRTILEILYEAGFNSKSSFNYLFKKKTGKTPSEFRKNS